MYAPDSALFHPRPSIAGWLNHQQGTPQQQASYRTRSLTLPVCLLERYALLSHTLESRCQQSAKTSNDLYKLFFSFNLSAVFCATLAPLLAAAW